MTTEERVMSLFESANPVPEPGNSAPETASDYLATLDRRTSTMTLTALEPKAPERNNSKRPWLMAAAAVAALALVVGGLALLSPDQDEERPADVPEVTTRVEPDPAAVAAAFVSAIDSHDHDNAQLLLADDATIQMLGSTDVAEFEQLLAHLEAVDARYDLTECTYAEPAVTCRALYTNAWFDPLDEPATTATFFVRVEDGQVTALRQAQKLPDRVWLTWSSFVRDRGEGDWGAMAKGHPDGMGIIGPMLTDESIELHRQYTTEFVEARSDG
jgi:hypothetical protein